MTRVLVTAFGPYDEWQTNASWLALVRLAENLPERPAVVTRRYPVDFAAVRESLSANLAGGFDYSIHLGQAPGSPSIQFESFAVNVGGIPKEDQDEYQELVPGGPAAYRTRLPIADWAKKIRAAGIPARVSYHAGTYLCNATLYWANYLAETNRWATRSVFIHIPIDTTQAIAIRKETPSLPAELSARAVRLVLEEMEQFGSAAGR